VAQSLPLSDGKLCTDFVQLSCCYFTKEKWCWEELHTLHSSITIQNFRTLHHIALVFCSIKKNTEALLEANREVGLEVYTETKYMVMSHHWNAGQSTVYWLLINPLKMWQSSTVTTVTNQNSPHKGIKTRLNLGNASYHSVQCLVFPSLLWKLRLFLWVWNLVFYTKGRT